MDMTRRGFFGAAAAATAAVVTPPPMEVIRASTDMDITVGALLHAIGIVGEGPYTLRVPPENLGYARRALNAAFGPDDARYRDFTIVVERLDQYVDSWALDNGRRQFYTQGA